MKNDDHRTQESQRRHRIEAVVQGIMSDLSLRGVHAGTVLDENSLESIAASFRAAISKAGLEGGICLRCGINQNRSTMATTF